MADKNRQVSHPPRTLSAQKIEAERRKERDLIVKEKARIKANEELRQEKLAIANANGKTSKKSQKAELIGMGDGNNTIYAKFVIAVNQLGKNADHDNVEDMRRKFYQYIKLCAKYDIRLSNAQAYASIGIDSNTASNWQCGKNAERKALIDEIKSVCSQYRETLMINNELNPVLGIWWQKNYDGLSDNPAPQQNLGKLKESRSTESIQEKYKDLIDND